MGARSEIVRSSPLVKAVLGMIGVPSRALAALDAATVAIQLLPESERRLLTLADNAASDLSQYASHEYRELSDADKDAVQDILERALRRHLNDPALLVAALEGTSQARGIVRDNQAEQDLRALSSRDAEAFCDGLLGRICGSVQRWVREEPIRYLATLEGVAETLRRTKIIASHLDDVPASLVPTN